MIVCLKIFIDELWIKRKFSLKLNQSVFLSGVLESLVFLAASAAYGLGRLTFGSTVTKMQLTRIIQCTM